MEFDQLFGGSMPKNVHLPKISSPLQYIVSQYIDHFYNRFKLVNGKAVNEL